MNAPPTRTVADLQRRLGGIPAERIRLTPTPGTATIDDLLHAENAGCELVDGTLVEKPVGQEESFSAGWLITLLNMHVVPNNLGIVTGEQGFVELSAGLVRAPDVSFFSWDSMPGRRRPKEPFPRLAPDLAVEVLSPSNSRREMACKRGEYFGSGVREVWEIDPRSRRVKVYGSANDFRELGPTDTLAPAVLPGFTLSLAETFGQLDREG